MKNYTVAITLCGNRIMIDDVIATLKRYPCINEADKYLKFDIHPYEGTTLHYCYLTNIDDANSTIRLCKMIGTLADKQSISFYIVYVNHITGKIETFSNDYQPFFNSKAKQLFGIRENKMLINNRCLTLYNWLMVNFSHDDLTKITEENFNQWISLDTVHTLYQQYHADIWLLLQQEVSKSKGLTLFGWLDNVSTHEIETDDDFKVLLVHCAITIHTRNYKISNR